MVDSKDVKAPIAIPDDAHSYSINNWQQYFDQIFKESNSRIKQNGFSNNSISFCRGYIISHITQDLGDLAEYIRELKKDRIRIKIGSIFAWVSALANELEFLLGDAIWGKYPGFCPYCGLARGCVDAWWTKAQREKGKDPDPKPKPGETPHTKPQNLNGWVTIWDQIYGDKYRIGMPLSDIMYKLYEENAEVLEELDEEVIDKKKVTREVADFLSWLFALIIKLESYNIIPKNDLSDILFEKFGQGCPRGEGVICRCIPPWLSETSKK